MSLSLIKVVSTWSSEEDNGLLLSGRRLSVNSLMYSFDRVCKYFEHTVCDLAYTRGPANRDVKRVKAALKESKDRLLLCFTESCEMQAAVWCH